jgi:hypothetical protein
MASPNLTELAATTLRSRTGKLADNMSNNNALLNRLKKRGNIKTVTGGRTIIQELEYAENGTTKWYSGYETLNISPSDVFTAAEYNYAQCATTVSISGLEQLQNSGEEAIINLLILRIRNAEKSLANTVATGCYSDGLGDGGKQIGGLQLLVDSTPATGTVGGIDAASYTFWRNIASTGTTASATNIQSLMNAVALQLVRGAESPDLIMAGSNKYKFYLDSLQAIQRISTVEDAGAGFTSLKYFGAGKATDVVLDGGVGGACPADSMYFLNTDYIFLRPHVDRNFAPIGVERHATNQDAMVKLIGFAGNMTVSNRRMQGVLTN